MDRESHRRRVKRNDRIAHWVITVTGVTVIAAVIAILFLIARVALPLFGGAEAQPVASFRASGKSSDATVLAVGMDEYFETCFALSEDAAVTFYDVATGDLLDRVQLDPPKGSGASRIVRAEVSRSLDISLLWDDGTVTLDEVLFKPVFHEQSGNRTIEHALRRVATIPSPADAAPVRYALARQSEDGVTTRVTIHADQTISIQKTAVETDFFGNSETKTSINAIDDPLPGPISAYTVDAPGEQFYIGTENGYLLRWNIADPDDAPELTDTCKASEDGHEITALSTLLGDVSIAVGDSAGALTVWLPVLDHETIGYRPLTRVHPLRSHDSAVRQIVPSLRRKSVISIDDNGTVHVDHMTSERHLISQDVGAVSITYSMRANGWISIDSDDVISVWHVENPHPETSLKTLFGQVFYENYEEPDFVWQSSAGTDDFEPKLSLTPLVFGSIKGTLYAMLIAVPLGILGALYMSQFTTESVRRVVKPAVEIMAAVPSVVIGFLAALWFAPIVEDGIVTFILLLIMLPIGIFVAVMIWQGVRGYEPLRQRVERGYEFVLIVPALLIAFMIAQFLQPVVNEHIFGGDFKLWLFQEMGERYDPRNCIIIAFALGFAVIPIIFTMSDDALTNVPESLRAASLALGASRWQTVRRVMLPSASPGIFAGAIIGFGRAVGETMIVLMATGNTPIIDLSPFNGMRTLSANIAVEIPEAPVDGTLYRVLFLSAVVLFLMTFVLNTVADVIRQRLRKQYGQF